VTFASDTFAGQTAVVTGGTRGIGAAIARAFLDCGARVHSVYRSNTAAAEAFAAECGAAAGRLRLQRFDVADHAAVETFWEALEEDEPGGVQVLVNNSGIRRDAVLAMMSPEDWSSVIATNLTGCYNMSKFAVRSMMRRRYGRIVMITSPAGGFGFAGQGNYGASKAGQVGLMRSLCKEVATRKITVNCVSPGFIETELIADLSDELKQRYLESVPSGRFGTPAEVAYAVQCLAAPEAAYVTGAILEVSGGL